MNTQLKQLVLYRKYRGKVVLSKMNFTNTQFKTAATQYILLLSVNNPFPQKKNLWLVTLAYWCFALITNGTNSCRFSSTWAMIQLSASAFNQTYISYVSEYTNNYNCLQI